MEKKNSNKKVIPRSAETSTNNQVKTSSTTLPLKVMIIFRRCSFQKKLQESAACNLMISVNKITDGVSVAGKIYKSKEPRVIKL